MGRNKTQQDYDNDNRSRQLDPQQDAYWQSRGYDEKPSDPPTVTSDSTAKETEKP